MLQKGLSLWWSLVIPFVKVSRFVYMLSMQSTLCDSLDNLFKKPPLSFLGIAQLSSLRKGGQLFAEGIFHEIPYIVWRLVLGVSI